MAALEGGRGQHFRRQQAPGRIVCGNCCGIGAAARPRSGFAGNRLFRGRRIMLGGHRSERIAEEIRNEVSLMLAGELKDPRLAGPVMVTEVRLGAGMRTVRVFVSLAGNEAERATTLEGLQAAKGYVRHELVERLHMRRAPEVLFILDETEEYGNRIENLLRKAKEPEERSS